MVEDKFIDKIEELRHHTYSRITELQKNLCPMVKKIYLNNQYEYWYEGYRYNLWEDNVHYYAVNDIPYCYDNELKNTTFMNTLDHLVEEEKVWPFLLFINGMAIKWSKITVIHDYDYSYLRIDDITPDYSFYATIVTFPLPFKSIRYGEDSNVITSRDRKGFYFGQDGYRLESTDFANIGIRLEILDPNIYYNEVNLNTVSGTMSFEGLPDGFIPTLDNILTFNSDGSFNSEGPSVKLEDSYHGTYGLFKVLDTDSTVKWAILMYSNNRVEKSKSHVYDREEDLSREDILTLLTENTDKESDIWKEVIAPLIDVFDFDHKFNIAYDTNISDATKYITRYDFRMWRDVFTKDINMKSYCYTGEQFKKMSDSKGYIHFSRKHTNVIEDTVIMFVNSKLYKYMIDINYTTNTINIPTFGILDDDHVEILMFNQCNNNILDITVPDDHTMVYIHPDYDLDNCYLMSEYCPDATYDVADNPERRKQYIVDFIAYLNTDTNEYEIVFDNDEYYGKPLKVVPKRQFRYYRFKQKEGQYKIILPTQFNYCHDPDRYLIFINGIKIDRTEYTITFMNKDRPFDKLVLYISTILDAGDYIDIFYIPELLVEKYTKESMPNSGLILLEDSDSSINYPTTYPLSKYTSLLFVNGMKVNPLDIKDISLNSMLINVDKYNRDENGNVIITGTNRNGTNNHAITGVDNITIMEYIPGNKEVAGYLKGLYEQIPSGEDYDPSKINFNKSASDNWKDLIKTLLTKYAESGAEYRGLEKIFGKVYTNDNPDQNYKDNFAGLKSILYDVIMEYYISRDDTTTGSKFVYDFERDWFDNESATSDTKLITLFPEKDKLLDYIGTEEVATQEDVMDGQKYIPYNQ